MNERRTQSPGAPGGSGSEPPAGETAPRKERGSFGAWLRTQREARGVTMQAIAEDSKISLRYLEALEGDRFDVLPAPVFVRGFLREYARVVGLDGDEVVNFYLLARPSKAAERGGDGPLPAPRGDRPAVRRTPLLGYFVLIAALLALFVGVAAGISWWASRNSSQAKSAPLSPADPVAPPNAVVPEPQPEPQPEPEPASAAPSQLTSSPEINLPAVAPAPDGRLSVVLEFQQDCWVEVVIDGRRRESELKAGGETLALEADEYVSLTLGNAPAVRVEVNGRQFPLSIRDSRVVRDLRIDRSALVSPARADPDPADP